MTYSVIIHLYPNPNPTWFFDIRASSYAHATKVATVKVETEHPGVPFEIWDITRKP